MSANRILLLSVDSSLAQRIDDAMKGRATTELAQALTPELIKRPCVILLDRDAVPPERSLAAALSIVTEGAGGRPVVLVTDETDADQILHAIRAGADDVIPRGAADSSEIAAILGRLLNQMAADHGSSGRLSLVMGADQESAALVATDMAVSRARSGSSTLLIDCTMPTSAAEAYLDLPVRYGLASAIADIDRLDASLLSNTLARHEPSGLMLLTLDGGSGAEPSGIAPADIAALIRLLRTCCGDVLLCTGSLRHSGLLRTLASLADHIDLLCAQSIREMEACRHLLDRMGQDEAMRAKTQLLVWDHQPGILLDSRRMADVLQTGSVLPLPIDPVRARNALNAGRPLAVEGGADRYMRAIRQACGVEARLSTKGLDRLRRLLQRPVEPTA